MQTLASYLIEKENLSNGEVAARSDAISARVRDWLLGKGVTDPNALSGSFNSLTLNSSGNFSRRSISNEMGTYEEIRLEEPSRGGQLFSTVISKVLSPSKIAVHATLSVRNSISVIAPVATDPRCPALIRSLLELYPDWTFGGNAIGTATAQAVAGTEDAEILLSELVSESRLRPIVVVSQNEDEFIWPCLPDDLAYDLTGLANVVSIDDEASWALTEHLGKKNSCYLGAVRLYWPGKKSLGGDIQIPGTVWTASALLSMDHDGKGSVRFRSAIRRAVMSVAALTVEPPSAIRQIQNFSARERLQQLEARANSNTEELELARLYVEENEELKAEVAQLKADLSALSGRAEVAEFALSQVKSKDPLVADAPATEDDSPSAGETRYYKKTHSKQAYDVLVRVSDCGHSSWQNSAGADKARKGLERLEKRDDWKNLQHCGSCTGGGLWRAKW